MVIIWDKNLENGLQPMDLWRHKKVYIGKGHHYFPKSKIGHFIIEAYDVKVGDKILVTGPTTGAKEMMVTEMRVNNEVAESATKVTKSRFLLTLEFELQTNSINW